MIQDIDLKMNVFEALIANHEVQRELCQQLEGTQADDKRKQLFAKLKLELLQPKRDICMCL